MQLGMIGLGRMGANMVRRLIQGGHDLRSFRRFAESGSGAREGRGNGCQLAPGSHRQVAEAAHPVADGAGGGR